MEVPEEGALRRPQDPSSGISGRSTVRRGRSATVGARYTRPADPSTLPVDRSPRFVARSSRLVDRSARTVARSLVGGAAIVFEDFPAPHSSSPIPAPKSVFEIPPGPPSTPSDLGRARRSAPLSPRALVRAGDGSPHQGLLSLPAITPCRMGLPARNNSMWLCISRARSSWWAAMARSCAVCAVLSASSKRPASA